MASTFTLGGKTAIELGLIMLRTSQRPVLSGTVDRTMQIAGKHGAGDFGADLSPRLFNLECAAVTRNPVQLQQTISALAAHLTDAYGRPRNLELIFSLQPLRKYNVRYSGSIPIERFVGLGQFTLPLIAYDPRGFEPATAYDIDPGQYDTDVQYDQGAIYPNTEVFQWQYSYHMSSLYNYGSMFVDLRIDIVGTVTNPKITNVTTGGWISLQLTNGPDDVLVIDSQHMGAYKVSGGNRINVMSGMSGDFFKLALGQNKLVFEGVAPNSMVYYKWNNTFM